MNPTAEENPAPPDQLQMKNDQTLTKNRKAFGTELRKLRKERKASGEALARKASLALSSLFEIERGVRPAGRQVSHRLALALGLTGEARDKFLSAGLATTRSERLPSTAMDFPPEIFEPIWRLLANQNIKPAP